MFWFFLLLALASCTTFTCLQDMVNWMGPGLPRRPYALYLGKLPTCHSLPSSSTWFVVPESMDEPAALDYNRVLMNLEDFLAEADGLDLFSRGFMEVHVAQDLELSLPNLAVAMILMKMHPKALIRFPMPRDVPSNFLTGMRDFFGDVRHIQGEYPYADGAHCPAYVECLGRTFARKRELLGSTESSVGTADAGWGSWAYNSCNVM